MVPDGLSINRQKDHLGAFCQNKWGRNNKSNQWKRLVKLKLVFIVHLNSFTSNKLPIYYNY